VIRLAPRLRRRLTALRPVTSTDVRHFLQALRGHRPGSACRAIVDGAFVVLTLRRRGLRPLVSRRSDLPDASPNLAAQVAEAVEAGLNLLPVHSTCLRRSVTLLREMHRSGLGADLHIGVRRGPGGIEAHAWVQAADRVVNDDPALISTYTPLSVGQAERYLARFE
jgi:hypothetical protein